MVRIVAIAAVANAFAVCQFAEAAAKKATPQRGRTGATIIQGENRDVEDTKSTVERDAVKLGMTREEVVQLAGKPWMKVTIPGTEGHYNERLRYQLKSGGVLSIMLTDGKVTDVKHIPE